MEPSPYLSQLLNKICSSKALTKSKLTGDTGTLLIYVAGAPDQTITQGWPAVIKTNKIESNKLKHELLRK